eukprot:1486074-Prymnesium_polylepis.1
MGRHKSTTPGTTLSQCVLHSAKAERHGDRRVLSGHGKFRGRKAVVQEDTNVLPTRVRRWWQRARESVRPAFVNDDELPLL